MKSQNQLLLDYLQAGGCITSRQAYEELGITQLATRISELKEDGHRIDCSKWKRVLNRRGELVKVKEYRLIPPKPEQGSMFPEPESCGKRIWNGN